MWVIILDQMNSFLDNLMFCEVINMTSLGGLCFLRQLHLYYLLEKVYMMERVGVVSYLSPCLAITDMN